MHKKLLLVLVLVFFGLAIFIYGYTQQDQNTTQSDMIQNNTAQNAAQNSTVSENNKQTNINRNLKDYDAVIIQKGPNTPQKRGTSVPISYTVTNKGKKTIYNAEIGSQNFLQNIDVLKPGETRKYTYLQYIPTNEDLAEWFDSSVKLNSPLEMGGAKLTFTDDKNVFHSIRSNPIEIKLVD